MNRAELTFHLFQLDPTGRIVQVVGWISRYRAAAITQHERFFCSWRSKEFDQALAELHFFLISMNRTIDSMTLVGNALGGKIRTYISSIDYSPYRDARNHFEHLDDRLFGSGRNFPKPITENGATRTVHFGLNGKNNTFSWGQHSIDISPEFLGRFLTYVDGLKIFLVDGKGTEPW